MSEACPLHQQLIDVDLVQLKLEDATILSHGAICVCKLKEPGDKL